MTLDADGDGALQQSEVSDPRLQSLFARIDADKNKTLTAAEMNVFHAQESATLNAAGRGGPRGPRSPGGFGPAGDRRPPQEGPPKDAPPRQRTENSSSPQR